MPTEQWLEQYNKVKDFLVSPVNYAELYKKSEIDGKKLFLLDMGKVVFTTNDILVRDPLVWLHKNEQPYLTQVPTGEYSIKTLVAEIDTDHYRYIATRVQFTENVPVIYREALKGDENLSDVDADSFFGFHVDAGLATIVDTKARDAYCDFSEKWYQENPDKNIYNDYLAEEFRKSYLNNPQYQREGGDWINFNIPETNLYVPMIQTGWGDGKYPVYFGYDENGDLCDVVMEYIFVGEIEE